MKDDALFMREALKEAAKAFEADEVPVGAVLVHENRVIARGHNQVELLQDATAHAEMICLTAGAGVLGNWRLAANASLTLGGSVQRVQSLQTGRRDRNSALTLAYTRQLRSDISLNVDLRHLRHTSNTGGGYREHGIGAALNVAF